MFSCSADRFSPTRSRTVEVRLVRVALEASGREHDERHHEQREQRQLPRHDQQHDQGERDEDRRRRRTGAAPTARAPTSTRCRPSSATRAHRPCCDRRSASDCRWMWANSLTRSDRRNPSPARLTKTYCWRAPKIGHDRDRDVQPDREIERRPIAVVGCRDRSRSAGGAGPRIVVLGRQGDEAERRQRQPALWTCQTAPRAGAPAWSRSRSRRSSSVMALVAHMSAGVLPEPALRCRHVRRAAPRGSERSTPSSPSWVPSATTRPSVDEHDPIGHRDRAGTMGDHDRGASVHHRRHRLPDLVLLRSDRPRWSRRRGSARTGRTRSHRAIAIRCRCPPENEKPRSPRIVS